MSHDSESPEQLVVQERDAIVAILGMMHSTDDLHGLMQQVTVFLKHWSGCDAVGIRLRDGDDYPYFETRGFPEEFVEAENRLCEVDEDGILLRDSNGHPVLECMCGNILRGRFDPSKPFFTPHGSFWSNCTTKLLASTTEADRQARTRNRCNGEGYESVALVPMRAGGETFGLLQFNDKRTDRFTPEKIAILERVGDSLAIGLAHRKMAEALRRSEERWQFALEGAGDGVWDWDVPTNTVYYSRQWKAMLGYEEREIGNTLDEWDKRVHPDDRQHACAELQKHFGGETPVYVSEHRVLCKDGTYKWILDRGKVIRRSPDGKPQRVIGTHTDITNRKRIEEALRESELRLRQTTTASNTGLWDWDLRTNEVYFSPSWKSQIGYEDHEIANRFEEWQSRVHPDDLDHVLATVKAFIANPWPNYELTFRFRHKDGSYRWILTKASVFRDEQGKPCRMLGSHIDITERKQAEEALRKSEEEYRTLFREMLDGFALHEIICDEHGCPVDYRFLIVNPSFERLTGLRADAVQGRTVLEIMPETERHWIETYGRVAQTGEPAHFENYSSVLNRHFEITAFRPAPNQFACIFVDITDRKRIEESLRQSEQRLQLSLDAAQAGTWMWNLETGEVVWDDRMLEIFGLAPGAFAGTYEAWKLRIHPDDLPKAERLMREVLELCEHGECEYRVWGRAGDVRHVLVTAAVMGGVGGEPLRMAGIAVDVTDRKRTEQERALLEDRLRQMQKFDALGQLSAGIAHDFGNLLMVIRGNLDLLSQRFGRDATIGDMLNSMQHATDHATAMTRSLLTFSHDTPAEKKKVDFARVIEEAIQLVHHVLPANVHLDARVRCEDSFLVRADRDQWHRVIMNLAVNARDAMPEGGTLRIDLSPITISNGGTASAADGEVRAWVRLTVGDTGKGIPPEVRLHIFEPFFTTKPRGKGTGLGLSVVHGIVEDHGGRIDVRSEPGMGTVFVIDLPRVTAEEDWTAATAGFERSLAILLVVPDPYLRANMASCIENAGYRVYQADNGNTALERLRDPDREIRLTVLDARLPEPGGAAWLRQMRLDFSRMPVVVFCGEANPPTVGSEADTVVLPREFDMYALIHAIDARIDAGNSGEARA